MSNYHYNDMSSSKGGCLDSSQYSSLQNTTNYTCDLPCLCRWNEERSSKDKLYYDWFVLDKPMVLVPNKRVQNPVNTNNCK